MIVRDYRPQDRKQAFSVAAQGAALSPRNVHITDDRVVEVLAEELFGKQEDPEEGSDQVFVAVDDQKLHGFIAVNNSEEIGEINWLAVERDGDPQSIATALIGAAEDHVRTCGFKKIRARHAIYENAPNLAEAFKACSFEPTFGDALTISMGRPLDDLPEMPALAEGYEAHTYRPGDEPRWLDAKNDIFESDNPPGTFEKLYSERTDFDPNEVIFVERGEELAAICAGVSKGLTVCEQEFRMSYLDWVGTRPAHRGKRLGRYTCTHCLHHLKAIGNPYCTLSTDTGRPAAVALYEKLGFRVMTTRPNFAKDL